MPPIEAPTDLGEPAKTSLIRQFSTIGRRQIRLIVSDRGYFVFLAMLPFIMGVLSLSVPGDVEDEVASICAEISEREEGIVADILAGTSLGEARKKHGYHLLQRPGSSS